ncbi:acetyl-CoA C-acetyltransferase, partial [Acinetobacter baumannii]
LEDAYEGGRAMGTFGEDTAERYQFTREAQDAYAIETLRRAKAAIETGVFDKETIAVTVSGAKGGETVFAQDEHPRKLDA